MSERGSLLQQVRNLHEYLCLLGEHINQIHDNIDQIEKNLGVLRNEHQSTIETNKVELEQIKSIMIVKSEVEDLFQELNTILMNVFPKLREIIPEQLAKE
ncbi:MAG: hypothetical protein V1915_00130 [Candidatus Bathyarchaeota archaeon]